PRPATHAYVKETVDAENRRGPTARFKQFPRSLPAPLQAIRPREDPGIGARGATVYGLQKGFAAFADGAKSGVMPDKSHAAMAQGAEVTDSLLDPLAIVHSNVGDIFL